MSANQKTVKLLSLLPSTYQELQLSIQTTDIYKVHEPRGNPATLQPTENFDFNKVFNAAYKRALIEETTQSKHKSRRESVFYTANNNFNSRKSKTTARKPPQPRNPQGRLVCDNCKERGHTKDKCKSCPICLKYGHDAKNCFQLEAIRKCLDLSETRASNQSAKSNKSIEDREDHVNILEQPETRPGTASFDESCCFVTLGKNSEPQKTSEQSQPTKSQLWQHKLYRPIRIQRSTELQPI